jgi:hypothetical protein
MSVKFVDRLVRRRTQLKLYKLSIICQCCFSFLIDQFQVIFLNVCFYRN